VYVIMTECGLTVVPRDVVGNLESLEDGGR
jgi:hypothetical protein